VRDSESAASVRTVYAILAGGLAQAASAIGLDYPGVLQHDGWHSLGDRVGREEGTAARHGGDERINRVRQGTPGRPETAWPRQLGPSRH
jgi:hypothetical protein